MMAANDFLPRGDSALLMWARGFSFNLSQSPLEFGVSVQVAQELELAVADFEVRLRDATEPTTRGLRTVFLKDEAKAKLVQLSRAIARQVRGQMDVTDAQRESLGLSLRASRAATIPAPASAPVVNLTLVSGRVVQVKLSNEVTGKRGRPRDARGAALFSFVGDEPPIDTKSWRFEGNTRATTNYIEFPDAPNGSAVWIVAHWFNPNSVAGPMSEPRTIHIAGGSVLPRSAAQASLARQVA